MREGCYGTHRCHLLLLLRLLFLLLLLYCYDCCSTGAPRQYIIMTPHDTSSGVTLSVDQRKYVKIIPMKPPARGSGAVGVPSAAAGAAAAAGEADDND